MVNFMKVVIFIYLDHLKSEFTHALNFKISVEIQCSHNRPTNDWYNILRVGRGGNNEKFGDRLFMIGLDNQRRGVLNLAYNTNRNDNGNSYDRIQRECNEGEWNTYSLTQRQIQNNTSLVNSTSMYGDRS